MRIHVVFLLFFTSFCFGQQKISFDMQPSPSYPLAAFGEDYRTGCGGLIGLGLWPAREVKISLQTGFIYYPEEKVDPRGPDGAIVRRAMGDGHFVNIPVIIAFQFYFRDEGLRPFLRMGGGYNRSIIKINTFKDTDSRWVYRGDIGFGAEYQLNPEWSLSGSMGIAGVFLHGKTFSVHTGGPGGVWVGWSNEIEYKATEDQYTIQASMGLVYALE